ncbi:MAG: integrase catalytic domain-containing protein [Nocardioidaceae bacterium]
MAPGMPVLVASMRRHGELDITDEVAAQLVAMSAATIDRRLAAGRAELSTLRGRSLTKPGSLLKSQIPMRTWADWDDHRPGFLEVDLVGHDGGDLNGQFCYTLTCTDIATGWTENRTVRNNAATWVFAALVELQAQFPFRVLGIDSDNGSEFINHHLLQWCLDHQITFTRSRPNNSNDGAHVEQKNWAVARRTAGYWRYETPGEIAADQPDHPAAETALQDQGRGQGHQEVRHHQPRPAPPRDRRPPRRPAEQGQAQEHHPPKQAERRLPLAGKAG